MPDSIYSRQPPTPQRRRSTYPGFYTTTRKPRRWPLVLRVTKGSVHASIVLPVLLNCIWTALIVYFDANHRNVGLPGSIIPSLSIVVGLMLVFRNGTSYDRFWSGRNCLNSLVVAIRSLLRYFLIYCKNADDEQSEADRQDTERIVRILIAILYAVKHNLRREFVGITAAPGTPYPRSPSTMTPIASTFSAQSLPLHNQANGNPSPPDDSPPSPGQSRLRHASSFQSYRPPLADSIATLYPVYTGLLPPEMFSLEHQGLALPLQLAMPIEAHIRKGVLRGWWAAPQASYLSGQLTSVVQAFSQMETIRTTPFPVAHMIHARQVLALYLMALPFALVDQMVWWSVPMMALLAFTLYGIEAIGSQLEDPFGYDRNDIKMDAIVEDVRVECDVLLEEWRESGRSGSQWG